jgi:hypothetical protein
MGQVASAAHRAVLDVDAIASVARALGLTWPIEIVLRDGPITCPCKRCVGLKYVGRRLYRDGVHVIELNAHKSPEVLTRALAHELRHGADAERLGSEFESTYLAERDLAATYEANPLEQSADAFADEVVRRGIRLVRQRLGVRPHASRLASLEARSVPSSPA